MNKPRRGEMTCIRGERDAMPKKTACMPQNRGLKTYFLIFSYFSHTHGERCMGEKCTHAESEGERGSRLEERERERLRERETPREDYYREMYESESYERVTRESVQRERKV